jgi:D-glycerate 3-kinase
MGARKFTQEEQERIIKPIVKKLIESHTKGKTTIIALQGGQGTGKTTIANFIKRDLKHLKYKIQSFSIDDFYTSAKERKVLQKKYAKNPFYQISRGMPGTHRVKELHKVLNNAKLGKNFSIPHFEKSKQKGFGDVLKKVTNVKGRQDFIILEGWCVGIPNVTTKKLQEICTKNRIDLMGIDKELKFNKTVIKHIKSYLPLWKLIDTTIMIVPDSSSCHKLWRLLQEKRLKEKKHEGMTTSQVSHFVDVFLPFTYVCYDKIKSDIIIKVDKLHNYYRVKNV